MKRRALLPFLGVLITVLVFAGCATTDHGFYKSKGLPEETLVGLKIDGRIIVGTFDGKTVNWIGPTEKTHRVIITSGVHHLTVSYHDGTYSSVSATTITFDFKPGKYYYLKSETDVNRVFYDIEEISESQFTDVKR